MAEINQEKAEVNARIVYWGVEGGGKTTNIRSIFGKLRPDHRGEFRQRPTPLDPTVTYDCLPIELGEIAGLRTQLQIIGVPGAPEHAPTRKALLDQVDGVVFVVDAQRDRIDENLASFEELREAFGDYGRSLSELPLVVQYNKRDLADPFALEELHRRLDLSGTAAFEAVATDGVSVLQTLTTISKRVIRVLRQQAEEALASSTEESLQEGLEEDAAPSDADPPHPQPAEDAPQAGLTSESVPLETTLRTEESHPDADSIELTAVETESLLDSSFDELTDGLDAEVELPGLDASFSIVSVGQAERVGPRSVRLPLVLEEAGGGRLDLALRVSLDDAGGAGES
jgi:signal recognition particle receptor subunit beta